MKLIIYIRFLFKSLFDIPFTAFDKFLADAICTCEQAPDFCKIVSGLLRDALLPEVFDTFLFDRRKDG